MAQAGYVLGRDLYEGTAGVAYFLSELYAATREPIFRATARGAFERALNNIDVAQDRPGLFDGATGVLLTAHLCAPVIGLEFDGNAGADEMLRRVVGITEADVIVGRARILLGLMAILAPTRPERRDAIFTAANGLVSDARALRNGLS